MPNRYEREIEEILNRMEESEPHKGLGDRIRPFRRRPARQRGLPRLEAPHIPLMEFLLLVAIFLILLAAGLAFYDGDTTPLSGWIGLAGVILFFVALVAGWRDRFRPAPPPQWRGNTLASTRIRRGPLAALAAQLRIWRLRQHYRRGQAAQDDPDD
jgi:hypothetical protein